MTSNPPDDDSLSRDVAHALEAHEFFLLYQPEIDLHSNGFAGVEALIRWRHPLRGILAPADFLELLEASGDITRVGNWALETACFQGAEWHTKGYRFAVAVNVSVEQLRHDAFVTDVRRCLRSSRFSPVHLTLEFSFASLEVPRVLDNLSELRSLGVHLAIDDFLPGRPRFEDLARLPIDILKLDRRYVATASQPHDASMMGELVLQARALNVRVFASGVEDAAQRDHLRDEHVAVGQGFHFAHPFSAQDIDRFLEDYALFSGRPL